jgi:hypothetical protein
MEESKKSMDEETLEAVCIDAPTFSALTHILTYLKDDEYKHWLECGSPRKGHIYCDIVKVNRWVSDVATELLVKKDSLPLAEWAPEAK